MQDFRPSQFIGDAWVVVESIRRNLSRRGLCSVNLCVAEMPIGWEHRCTISGGQIETVEACAKTMPMVICDAALRTIGIEHVQP